MTRSTTDDDVGSADSRTGSLRAARWALVLSCAILVGTAAGGIAVGRRMALHHAPLVDAVTEARLHATTSHLWLEEILAGDRREEPALVRGELELARSYLRTMLTGGSTPEGPLRRIGDFAIRARIEALDETLGRLEQLTEERLGQVRAGGPGAPADVEFDQTFRRFLDDAAVLENEIRGTVALELRLYSVAFGIALAVGTAVFAFLTWHTLRHHRRHAGDLRRLLRSQERFARFAHGTEAGFLIHDVDRRHTEFVNRSLARIVDRSPDELARSPAPFFDAVAAEDRERLEAVLDGLSGSAQRCVVRVETTTGSRSIRVVSFPIRVGDDDAVEHVGHIVEDVSDEVAAERHRRALEAKMQYTQKLESLGVLAGGIAHDFNNLLMGVMGNTDLALLKMSDVSPARSHVESIRTAAQRAADLAHQMLAYSGRGHFVVEEVDLSELVREMVHLLQVTLSKKVVLKLDLSDALPTVRVDVTQIRQVVLNLVTNASDAIGDVSGVVAVATGCTRCDPDYLGADPLLGKLEPGEYVSLEVSDTGAGMDAATVEQVFDPFFSTKETGRGLGLSAVLGIVRGHRGGIRVYSEVERGTTFKLLLPAVGASGEAPAPVADDGAERLEADGTVLLVDDEETVRTVGASMLSSLGFEVLLAADGAIAVETFRDHADDVSLVILDMSMPHVSGEEAFRRIRTIRSDTPVILSSGYNEAEARTRFAGKGLAGFLQKPYRLEDLREAIRGALETRSRG